MDDASALERLLPNSPRGLCIECLAWTSGIDPDRIEAALPILRRNFWVTIIVQSSCARCLRERDLLTIDR